MLECGLWLCLYRTATLWSHFILPSLSIHRPYGVWVGGNYLTLAKTPKRDPNFKVSTFILKIYSRVIYFLGCRHSSAS